MRISPPTEIRVDPPNLRHPRPILDLGPTFAPAIGPCYTVANIQIDIESANSFTICPFANMQEITCPYCENNVTITPDAAGCSVCGTDLRKLISPDAAAGYFYQRASDMATSGRKQQALTEVNRGLTYADTSELRLLGAILSKQVGDFAQMRTHVAAIPVDDGLRSEGEWLLRSHQSKQAGGRAATSALPTGMQDDAAAAPSASKRSRSSWPLILAMIILVALALTWFWGRPDAEPSANEMASASTPSESVPTARGLTEPASEPAAASETDGDKKPAANAEEATAAEEVSPTSEPSPTPEPTEEPTATPSPTPDLGANGPVDMPAFFEGQGYLGLALLDIVGELVNGELQLSGEVSSANELDTVASLVGRVEGADTVELAEIAINPPVTYTISVGDNLWTISAYFYGDSEHMDDIFRLNREALGSPEFLPVGAVIELPRVEEE